MITRSLAVLLIVCISCKQTPDKRQKAAAAGEPQVNATVVTIKTTIEPAKKDFQHTIVIAGDKARSSDEVDSWRLFDLKANQVTYVDDVAKTQRTEPVKLPAATAPAGGAKRAIQGVETTQTVISSGAYKRELWIAQHPAIPASLFAMMVETQPPAEAKLLGLRGFPMADRAELPYGKGTLVIDRQVVKVEKRQVPRSMLAVPAGYSVIPSAAGKPGGETARSRR